MGHSKGFWDDGETEQDRDVTNRSFPNQRNKPSRTEAISKNNTLRPVRPVRLMPGTSEC